MLIEAKEVVNTTKRTRQMLDYIITFGLNFFTFKSSCLVPCLR